MHSSPHRTSMRSRKPRATSTSSVSRPSRFFKQAQLTCSSIQSVFRHVGRFYASFSYQAGSWNRMRRVITMFEWHLEKPVSCVGLSIAPGLQPRHLHVDAGLAEGGGALAPDHAQGEADRNRCQGREPRPVRHITTGGGCGAGELFRNILRLIVGLRPALLPPGQRPIR